jgi:hypothetical protein
MLERRVAQLMVESANFRDIYSHCAKRGTGPAAGPHHEDPDA